MTPGYFPLAGCRNMPSIIPPGAAKVTACSRSGPATALRPSTGAQAASIAAALKPGGELIVVDFERIEGKSSDWTMGHVRAGKEVFRKEIEAVGLEFVEQVEVKGEFCIPLPRRRTNGLGRPHARVVSASGAGIG